MPAIHFTYPGHPQNYADGRSHRNTDQQAYWFFRILSGAFPNVVRHEWGKAPHAYQPGDCLICHPDFTIRGENNRAQRLAAVRDKAHVIVLGNDPLYDYVFYGPGRYNHHGNDGWGPKHYREGGFDGVAAADLNPFGIKQETVARESFKILLRVSTLQAERWKNRHPLMRRRAQSCPAGKIIPHPNPLDWSIHPITTRAPKPRQKQKVFVLASDDPRKNRHGLLEAFAEIPEADPVWMDMSWNWFDPACVTRSSDCFLAILPSFQDSMPYFGLESIARGMMLMGGEDWWDAPDERLIWRQAPEAMGDNIRKIRSLLRADDEIRSLHSEFRRLWHETDLRHLHTWHHTGSLLVDTIRRCLD